MAQQGRGRVRIGTGDEASGSRNNDTVDALGFDFTQGRLWTCLKRLGPPLPHGAIVALLC